MTKRNPLSTAETMTGAASPRLEHCEAGNPFARFTAGLAGPFWLSFDVPELDTFIEKPFSVVSPSVCICTALRAKHRAAPRARAYWSTKRALGQLISFSVRAWA